MNEITCAWHPKVLHDVFQTIQHDDFEKLFTISEGSNYNIYTWTLSGSRTMNSCWIYPFDLWECCNNPSAEAQLPGYKKAQVCGPQKDKMATIFVTRRGGVMFIVLYGHVIISFFISWRLCFSRQVITTLLLGEWQNSPYIQSARAGQSKRIYIWIFASIYCWYFHISLDFSCFKHIMR